MGRKTSWRIDRGDSVEIGGMMGRCARRVISFDNE